MKRISCTVLVVLTLTLWGCQSSDQRQMSGEGASIATVATTPKTIDIPPPVVPQAVNGQVDLRRLGDASLIVEMTYPAITDGDTVRVSWYYGSSYYEAPIQTVGATRPVIFTIPNSTVVASKGASVRLRAEYFYPGGDHSQISAVLPVSVIETQPPTDPGEKVADDLNTRYANTSLTCTGNTPAYYCNGVIIRSTQDGSYDPWNPSPKAISLGGVSFSYMRRDAYVTSLYHASGFTFLPQEQAKGKIVEYLCIYAYDAGTLVGPRGEKGCGLKPRSAPRADVSSCASVNVRTVAQWYAYTKTIQNRDYQCSLSTADATQFAASFQVRANRPPNMDALWNEMMVKTWDQDIPGSLPLESFFYTSAAGLAEAKIYQQKYRARTGNGWLPIIKLDLTKLNANPFSYNEADQAVQQ
jgi:hypothetical protein